MAQVKYYTPFGTNFVHTNKSQADKRVMEPWLYKEMYDKDGWLREGALEVGHCEVVNFKDGNNEAVLFEDNGNFVVEGTATGQPYRNTWRTIKPARDYFVSIVKKMYLD